MKEFIRKSLAYIGPIMIAFIIFLIYFFLYDVSSENLKILEILNLSVITTLLVTVVIALYLYHLESKRGRDERRLEQRLELRNRSLECYNIVKSLKIKIITYKASNDCHNLEDIAITSGQIKSYFTMLQEVYKELPGKVVLAKELETLFESYDEDKWKMYFLLERADDLERFKKSIQDAEGYLDCLGKALLKYSLSLQLE